MKKTLYILFFIFLGTTTFSQEDSENKPKPLITGYVNTTAEFTDADSFQVVDGDRAIGLAEAGVLVSYRPLKNLELKTTLVYSHNMAKIQDLVVEAYGNFIVKDWLKIGAGKFLTPLSPVNQYFYAPVNISGILPMVVSHHEILPQNISGFQVSGEFFENYRIGYNITYGSYLTVGHPLSGLLGLQGSEDLAPYAYTADISGDERLRKYFFGGSARIYANLNDILKVGFNYFDGSKGHHAYVILNYAATSPKDFQTIMYQNSRKYSMGVDMQFEYKNLKINGEYWEGNNTSSDKVLNNDYKAYYAEMMYEIKRIIPFVRYDFIEDINTSYFTYVPGDPVMTGYPNGPRTDIKTKCTAFGCGVSYRPMYELMIKFDYRKLKYNFGNIQRPPKDEINHWLISAIYSF